MSFFRAAWELWSATQRYLGTETQGTETEIPVTTTRTAFDGQPGVTFRVAGDNKKYVVHAYGDDTDVGTEFSSVQVGVPLPQLKRLGCARQLFHFLDEEKRSELSAYQLQVVLHLLGLQKPAEEVIEQFGMSGVITMEGFMLYCSSVEERTEMRLMIPVDLLLEIRSLMSLMTNTKSVNRESLKGFIQVLGLDWSNEDVDAFLASKDRGHIQFIDILAVKIRQGNEPGNRTLRVRNWWPGRWYVIREGVGGLDHLFLCLQNPEVDSGWQIVGEVLTAGSFISQPLVVGFRIAGNARFNVLISKMDPTRNQYLREMAVSMKGPSAIISPNLVVEIVKSFHHYADLTALDRQDLVYRVIQVVIEQSKNIQIDELMVVLKLLGQHAEPQHVTYLLQSNAETKPNTEELNVADITPMLLRMDMSITVPLDLLTRLKKTWEKLDREHIGALNAQQLKHLSNIMGLGWKSKEIASMLSFESMNGKRRKPHPEEVLSGKVYLDWVQFLDIFCEIYGDPFFEKRYSELYKLLDADDLHALSDEDLLPLLIAADLSLHEAEESLGKLLGNNLTVDARQFAAGLFEAELTGEKYPASLHGMARAYLNIDTESKGFIDPPALAVVFRKLGVEFTLEQRNALFKQLDKEKLGKVNFGEFVTRMKLVDKTNIGPLGEAFTIKKLCQLTSYEIATTIEELVAARDTEHRPVLERLAQKMIMTASKKGAKLLERRDMQRRRRAQNDEPVEDALLLPINLTDAKRRWIFILCYLNILRCFLYGLTSGGLNYLTELASNKYFPINEDDTSSKAFSNENTYLHYLLNFGPGIFFSFVEAIVISYDFLATAISLTNAVDVSLYKEPMDPIRVFICNAITAEALELGHPNNIRYGINPLKGSNKFILWFCGVLYAMRSGLSKFIVKIVLRRVVSRSAIRGASSLISLPIVAFWNSVLAVSVNKNVRTVALARSNLTITVDSILALHVELQRQMFAGVELQQAVDLARTRSHALDAPHVAFHADDITPDLKEVIMRSVAVAVVINREFHPNLEQVIKHLKQRIRIEPETISEVDDFDTFLTRLSTLNRLSTYTVLTFLLLALITDGNLLTSQTVLFKKVMTTAGFEPDIRGLKEMTEKFGKLVLSPKDIAFVMFDLREQQVSAEVSIWEEVELRLSNVLRFLSF